MSVCSKFVKYEFNQVYMQYVFIYSFRYNYLKKRQIRLDYVRNPYISIFERISCTWYVQLNLLKTYSFIKIFLSQDTNRLKKYLIEIHKVKGTNLLRRAESEMGVGKKGVWLRD